MNTLDQMVLNGWQKPNCDSCKKRKMSHWTFAGLKDNGVVYTELSEILESIVRVSVVTIEGITIESVTIEDLIGKKRNKEIIIARQMFCYIARMQKNSTGGHKWTHSEIGCAINKDHATSVHSCEVINDMLLTKQPWSSEYRALAHKMGLVINC